MVKIIDFWNLRLVFSNYKNFVTIRSIGLRNLRNLGSEGLELSDLADTPPPPTIQGPSKISSEISTSITDTMPCKIVTLLKYLRNTLFQTAQN